MERTTNYKLPRWVEEDRIMMDDFNKAFESIENGLTEIKAAAEGAATAAAAGQQGVSDLTPRVTAVEQAVKFVKLAGPTVTTAANQAVTFSLANINVSQYTAFLVVTQAASSNGSTYIQVNGSSLMTLCGNSWSEGCAVGWILPGEAKIHGMAQGVTATSSNSGLYNYSGSVELAWSAINSISVNGTSNAGMSCTLYGLKG